MDLGNEVIINVPMPDSSGEDRHHPSLTDGGGTRLVLQRCDHTCMTVDRIILCTQFILGCLWGGGGGGVRGVHIDIYSETSTLGTTKTVLCREVCHIVSLSQRVHYPRFHCTPPPSPYLLPPCAPSAACWILAGRSPPGLLEGGESSGL